jgi:hypothetical protein
MLRLSHSPQDAMKTSSCVYRLVADASSHRGEYGPLVSERTQRSCKAEFFFTALNVSRIAMKKVCLSDVHQHPPSPHDRSQCAKGRDHHHPLYSERLREHRHPFGQFESYSITLGRREDRSSSRLKSEAKLRSSEEDVYYRKDSMNC